MMLMRYAGRHEAGKHTRSRIASRKEIVRFVEGEVVCIAVGEKNSPTDHVHSLMIGRRLTNYLLGEVEE